MSWLTDIARPAIQALHAYEHAAWEPGLVRLHANELPWRSPIDPSAAGLNIYPEPHPHALMERLADLYGVPRSWALAGRGSDEAIDLLIRSYCEAREHAIVICPPTFGMYGVAARIQGANVVEVPLQASRDFTIDWQGLRRACDASVRLVFLCSPNNPTGNLADSEAVLKLARDLEGRALLVVDEAYVEFSGAASLAVHLADHPGLVVLRTLSKAHGLAGARCGTLLARPEIVKLLQKVIQPYAVTQLSIEAVFRALEPIPSAVSHERVALIVRERARVGAALAARPSVTRVWPSDANFLLVQFQDAARALEHAHAAGILVRDFRRLPGLSDALRLSIGTPEQNDKLLASLS